MKKIKDTSMMLIPSSNQILLDGGSRSPSNHKQSVISIARLSSQKSRDHSNSAFQKQSSSGYKPSIRPSIDNTINGTLNKRESYNQQQSDQDFLNIVMASQPRVQKSTFQSDQFQIQRVIETASGEQQEIQETSEGMLQTQLQVLYDPTFDHWRDFKNYFPEGNMARVVQSFNKMRLKEKKKFKNQMFAQRSQLFESVVQNPNQKGLKKNISRRESLTKLRRDKKESIKIGFHN